MSKRSFPLAIASVLVAVFCAFPAHATSLVTFVSGKGTDAGTCASPATPCRSFQFAIGQTSTGGEVKTLDPAHYGGMVITKSISVTGVEGASINRISGDAIVINAGPNDKISITGLTLDGSPAGQNGIVLKSAGSLTVFRCAIRNFKKQGIFLQPPAGTTKFLIADTIASDNGIDGIFIAPQGDGLDLIGTLDHVVMSKNGGAGLGLTAATDVTSVESTASGNDFDGFYVEGRLRLFHSTATGNLNCGVNVPSVGVAWSAANNFIFGNHRSDESLCGSLSLVGTQ